MKIACDPEWRLPASYGRGWELRGEVRIEPSAGTWVVRNVEQYWLGPSRCPRKLGFEDRGKTRATQRRDTGIDSFKHLVMMGMAPWLMGCGRTRRSLVVACPIGPVAEGAWNKRRP